MCAREIIDPIYSPGFQKLEQYYVKAKLKNDPQQNLT